MRGTLPCQHPKPLIAGRGSGLGRKEGGKPSDHPQAARAYKVQGCMVHSISSSSLCFPSSRAGWAEGKAIYQHRTGIRSLNIPGVVFKSSVKFFLCPSAGFRLLRAQISWAHLEWPPLEHRMGRDEPGAASYSGAAFPWEGTRWMVRLFCSRHWDTHLFSSSFLVSFQACGED